METCDNCGAQVPKCGTIRPPFLNGGTKVCCINCIMNPLGCRCKYGEYGVAETQIPEVSE